MNEPYAWQAVGGTIWNHKTSEDDTPAWAGIETFAAVALRVMAKTNPSKLKSEMVTVGISALL